MHSTKQLVTVRGLSVVGIQNIERLGKNMRSWENRIQPQKMWRHLGFDTYVVGVLVQSLPDFAVRSSLSTVSTHVMTCGHKAM